MDSTTAGLMGFLQVINDLTIIHFSKIGHLFAAGFTKTSVQRRLEAVPFFRTKLWYTDVLFHNDILSLDAVCTTIP